MASNGLNVPVLNVCMCEKERKKAMKRELFQQHDKCNKSFVLAETNNPPAILIGQQ